MVNPMRYKGKVVIVTGAAQGIGYGTALAFASEGARLMLLDIEDMARLEEVAGTCREAGAEGAVTAMVDVSDRNQVEAAVSLALDTWGSVDILVNNAGAVERPCQFEEIEDSVWEKILSVNVMGVINGCRGVIPIMKRQRSGRIINASSMYSISPQAKRAPYCVSKAAVNVITRVLAAELGPYGITVNAYAPGTIRTRMAGDAVTGARAITKLRTIPGGRFGEPEDVAAAILFLASPEAAYVTGVVLPVDGGTMAVKDPDRVWAGIEGPSL